MNTPAPLTVQQAADFIVSAAYSDSHVELDKDVLIDQLRTDYEIVGRFPTEKECEVLIMGDDDGSIPEELEEAFPQTSEFIGSHW